MAHTPYLGQEGLEKNRQEAVDEREIHFIYDLDESGNIIWERFVGIKPSQLKSGWGYKDYVKDKELKSLSLEIKSFYVVNPDNGIKKDLSGKALSFHIGDTLINIYTQDLVGYLLSLKGNTENPSSEGKNFKHTIWGEPYLKEEAPVT